MKTVGSLIQPLAGIAEEARALENQGADIGATVELGHEPMLQLAIAATATERMSLMTGICRRGMLESVGCGELQGELNALSKQGEGASG